VAEIKHLKRQKPTNAVLDLGDGDTVNLVFDREAVTPRWLSDTQRLALEESNALALATAFADVILSWDITDNGAEFPPTADNIAVLSFGALWGLMERIAAASLPSSAEGNASFVQPVTAPTASTPPSPTSPNGSQTSPSPASSESLSPT
jgi:hypothetical protein